SPSRYLAADQPPGPGARGARAQRGRPHGQEVRPPEGRRHRPSRRSQSADLRRRRQGPRPARAGVHLEPQQEGPPAWLEDGAIVYDIMRHETLVLTRAAVEKLEARFNG